MAMKRANGTGSVFKVKNKPLRKPYRAVAVIGWTDDGKAIRKNIGYFATAQQAYQALDKYIITPDEYEAETITFETAWGWLLEDKERRGVKIDSTFAMCKKYLAPLMDKPLSQLRTPHLQQIIDNNSSLKVNTLKNIKSKMTALYNVALIHDAVQRNYATQLIIRPDDTEQIHKPYTADEIRLLWQHTDDVDVRLTLVYIYTGMRPIELVLMPISDVHLSQKYMVGGVKTAAGKNRVIPIADCILPFVEDFINGRADGMLWDKSTKSSYTTLARRVSKRYGIKHAPHDTRHTFITICDNLGIPSTIIKAIVGHSRGKSTTEKVYTHKSISQLIDAVNLLPYGDDINDMYKLRIGGVTVE